MAPTGAIFFMVYFTLSNTLIFFDESGDLGWILDKPYRDGGSSRYFTIAGVSGKNNSHLKIGKAIRKLHKEQKWTSKNEKKWANIGSQPKVKFANIAVDLVKNNTDIEIFVAYLDKNKFPEHIRSGNHHLIYSWMVSEFICNNLKTTNYISLCPDSLNEGFGNTVFEDLIKKYFWFDEKLDNSVKRVNYNSHFNDGLAFCDFIAGAVQDHLENKKSDPFNIIKNHIIISESVI